MQNTKPPFRADHVGSLLRSGALKDARAKRERGEITPEQLKAIEDREIETLIKKQEATGLKSITDGENRRKSWQTDFIAALPGIETYQGKRKVAFQGGVQPQQLLVRVARKLGDFDTHPMIEHFKFLKAHTKATPKMTIPSPSAVHFRDGRDAVPASIYPDMEDFYRDLGQTYRKVVRAFADAGCRYLQLDEVNLTYLCDPKLIQQVRDRGENPEELPAAYARMINAAISDIPADMTITMHLCRGNFRSTFIASGGYEPVAETCSTPSTCTAISWSTTPSAPAASSRCGLCRRASRWCWVSSPRRPGRWNPRTRSSAASTRPRSSCPSISSASRRNAALRRARRATSSPKKSNGRSSA